jgi:hypothetical protein
MESWVANTLRTLGIILTAGFMLVGSLFLLLLAMCASQGGFGGNKHPEQVVPYIFAAVALLISGIWFIAWLGRGIYRSANVPQPLVADGPIGPTYAASSPASLAVPFHLSPLGLRSVYRLVAAIAAQILISAAAWAFNEVRFWASMKSLTLTPPTLILLMPYVLYHVPYALLIYFLLKRPDRRTFTYSVAVPAVVILQSLFSRAVLSYLYIHEPLGFFFMFLPWALHIVILVLAYKAIRQVGVEPQPASLVVAALVTFLYFVVVNAVNPFLYRHRW